MPDEKITVEGKPLSEFLGKEKAKEVVEEINTTKRIPRIPYRGKMKCGVEAKIKPGPVKIFNQQEIEMKMLKDILKPETMSNRELILRAVMNSNTPHTNWGISKMVREACGKHISPSSISSTTSAYKKSKLFLHLEVGRKGTAYTYYLCDSSARLTYETLNRLSRIPLEDSVIQANPEQKQEILEASVPPDGMGELIMKAIEAGTKVTIIFG